jgi:hypothetical protein
VSFKQREARRKKRAALARDRVESPGKARHLHTVPGKPTAAERWWLTLVTKKTCCANPACRGILREGREMAFRKVPQEALCVACADRAGISYRPSARWEQSRNVKVRKGAASMRDAAATSTTSREERVTGPASSGPKPPASSGGR